MKRETTEFKLRFITCNETKKSHKIIQDKLKEIIQKVDKDADISLCLVENYWKIPEAIEYIYHISSPKGLQVKEFVDMTGVSWFYDINYIYIADDPYKISIEEEDADWPKNIYPNEILFAPEVDWAHVYSWNWKEQRQKEFEKRWQQGVNYESIELKHPNETKFLIRFVVEEDNALLSNEIIAAINTNPKLEKLDESAKVEFVSSEPYTIRPPVNILTLAFLSKKDISIKEFIEIFENVTWCYQIRQSFDVHDPDKIHFDVEDAEWSKMLSHEGEEFLMPEIKWVHCFSWDWEHRRAGVHRKISGN